MTEWKFDPEFTFFYTRKYKAADHIKYADFLVQAPQDVQEQVKSYFNIPNDLKPYHAATQPTKPKRTYKRDPVHYHSDNVYVQMLIQFYSGLMILSAWQLDGSVIDVLLYGVFTLLYNFCYLFLGIPVFIIYVIVHFFVCFIICGIRDICNDILNAFGFSVFRSNLRQFTWCVIDYVKIYVTKFWERPVLGLIALALLITAASTGYMWIFSIFMSLIELYAFFKLSWVRNADRVNEDFPWENISIRPPWHREQPEPIVEEEPFIPFDEVLVSSEDE